MGVKLKDIIEPKKIDFKDLNQKRGVTVIMVSHDMKNAVAYGTKILHMATHVQFFGPTDEYMKTEAFARLSGGAHHND